MASEKVPSIANYNTDSIETNGTMESNSELIDSKSELVAKRKGRKRKCENTKNVNEEPVCDSPNGSEMVSQRGRKRKSVNYFALANPDIVNYEDDSSNASDNDVVRPTNKNTVAIKQSTGSPKKSSNSPKESKPKSKEQGMAFATLRVRKDLMDQQSILASVGLTKDKKSPSEEEDGTSLAQGENVSSEPKKNVSKKTSPDCSPVKEKKSKYRKTGNTVEMLNTLYSHFITILNEDLEKNGENRGPIPRSVSCKAEMNEITIAQVDSTETSRASCKRRKPLGKTKLTGVKNEDAYDESDLYSTTGDQQIACAICYKEMTKTNWLHHKQRFHNNLAWRLGEEPLDLTNQSLIMTILNSLYKNKKPLYCDKCDQAKKSVIGFLSHRVQCGKSGADFEDLKVPCKFCDKKILPASMPSHIKQMHEAPVAGFEEKPSKKSAEGKSNNNYNKKTQNVGDKKSKRQAATKALKVIQKFSADTTLESNETFVKYFSDLSFISSNISSTMLQKQLLSRESIKCKFSNCNFETSNLKQIKDHLAECSKKPSQGFVCKHCLTVKDTIPNIIQHIEEVHEVYVPEFYSSHSEDENSLSIDSSKDDKSRLSFIKKPSLEELVIKKPPAFLSKDARHKCVIFEKAYQWTLEFCKRNYETCLDESAFPCLKSNWKLMSVADIPSYLPQIEESCDVSFCQVKGFENVIQKDHTFRRFSLFEMNLDEKGNSTIFCGGPVTCMAWMPTPHSVSDADQILVIATKNDPSTRYTNDSNYNEKSILQFWNFGPLNNLKTSVVVPHQPFSICHQSGPVWHLEWCPSNCFDNVQDFVLADNLKRMGVLAVAGSDCLVHIYAIPSPQPLFENKFYSTNPCIRLRVMAVHDATLARKPFFPTKLSWTKAAGHRYIAVGYSNGMVAIFDIFTSSKLLRRRDTSNIEILLPCKSFQAHYHYISGLTLFHLNDGCRWLMTASGDRSVSVWDLNDVPTPITTSKKAIITDGIWMNNWLFHCVTFDEASLSGLTGTPIQQIRNFLSDLLYICYSSATVTSITGSDWLNGIMQGNDVGEIYACFPKQLVYNLARKMKYKKLLLGYTALIEKDKTGSERLKEHNEKEKALRNKLTVKRNIKAEEIPMDEEVTHLDYNPHYYKYEPLLYEEVTEKYGLVFCDHKMDSIKDFPAIFDDKIQSLSKNFQVSKPNIYPIQTINRIEFNPNRQATTYYATGYQAGFVKIMCMKFLNSDPQVKNDDLFHA